MLVNQIRRSDKWECCNNSNSSDTEGREEIMVNTGKANECRTGSCLCGAVELEVRLPSKFCAHCHCSHCRCAHGAAFVTWAGFRQEQVKTISGSDELQRYMTETGATRSFCRRCGSTLFYEGPRWYGEVHVARANIKGELDRTPSGHYYVDHGASWWTIADSLPQHGGETGDSPRGSQGDT
jgi:hypothetical protein